MHTPFWIQGLHFFGDGLLAQTMTETRIWCGNDPRPVILGGDAYWQWAETQALHDGLEGWHSTIFHSDPDAKFCVHPQHPDYAHVARIWELVNANVMVPENW
jgi:hypothetical protein